MESIIVMSSALGSLGVFLLPGRNKAFHSLLLHGLLMLTATSWAFRALLGGRTLMFSFTEGWAGAPTVTIDSLSAYFLLIISFTFLTATLYAFSYLKPYRTATNQAIMPDSRLSIHHLALLWLHISLILVVTLRGGKAFLTAWELMILASFALILFHGDRTVVVHVAVRFLVQMQVGLLLLTGAFFYVRAQGFLFGFDGVTTYINTRANLPLLAVFGIGFGITAGLVPLHTWLPKVHLVAPPHVSAIFSGVFINVGLYGLLRILTGVHTDRFAIGLTLLVVSVGSGLYGAIQSVRQRKLSQWLAYSSIQHMGIIGTGLGLGLIGLSLNIPLLAGLGFVGGMLHILNHSLIKSLLFYSAETGYGVASLPNPDSERSLFGRAPRATGLFLIGAVAVCGLPPLNGFISEFMIYGGLFSSLRATAAPTNIIVPTIVGVLIMSGVGIVATRRMIRQTFPKTDIANGWSASVPYAPTLLMLLPELLIVALMLLIACWPDAILNLVVQTLVPFVRLDLRQTTPVLESLRLIGMASAAGILLAGSYWFFWSGRTCKQSIVEEEALQEDPERACYHQ